jgi:hypothetical protein
MRDRLKANSEEEILNILRKPSVLSKIKKWPQEILGPRGCRISDHMVAARLNWINLDQSMEVKDASAYEKLRR